MESNGNCSSATGRWIGFAELIHFFDHAAGEALSGMKVVGL